MIFNFFLTLLLLCLPFQLGKHFWPDFSFVLGLKIDFLSPTLYLQDLILFSLFVLWVIQGRFKFWLSFFSKKKIIFVIFFFMLIFINIFLSKSHLPSLFYWLRLLEYIFLGSLAFQYSTFVLERLYKIIPFALIFEFLLGITQFIKQSSINGIFWLFGERTFNIFTPGIARSNWLGNVLIRPYGTFSHPNSLAGFVLISLILLLGKGKLRLIDKIAIVLGFVLIVLEFSRTVWLFVFFLSFTYVLREIINSLRRKSGSLNFTYIFVLVCLGLITFLFLKTTIDPSSFTNREDLAEVAIKLIKEYPLFGVGGNNFILALSNEPNSWRFLYWLQPVHNIFLLITSELGLVGLLMFFVILFKALRNLLQFTIYNLQFTILVALFAILFTGLFDHYWLTLIQNQLLFSIILGLSFVPFHAKIDAWNKEKE